MDRLRINGVELECAAFGIKSGQPPSIVLLHEGLGSVSSWRDFPHRLAEATGRGVFLYSRAGYGRSAPAAMPRPMDYLHREALDVLPKVLDAVEFERGVLLGHSDGGSIATIYAGGVQDRRVQGLVLIEPHFFVEDVNIAAIRKTAGAYWSTDLRSRLGRHHENADQAFLGWSTAWLDTRFKSFDITKELGRIRAPVLIVKGENDPYSTVLQIEVARQKCRCPLESIVVPDAGHSPHRDRPDVTLRAVSDFVDRLMRQHDESLTSVS